MNPFSTWINLEEIEDPEDRFMTELMTELYSVSNCETCAGILVTSNTISEISR